MDEFTLISDLFLFGGASRGQIAPKNRMIFEIQNLKKKGKKANGQREQPTPHQIPHTHTHTQPTTLPTHLPYQHPPKL